MDKQGLLHFTYVEEGSSSGMTAHAGLLPYLELADSLGLPDALRRHLHLRPQQGWSDAQIVLSLILLNLAGGDCVDDLRKLENDALTRVLEKAEAFDLGAAGTRQRGRRFRRPRTRTVPSPEAVRRYLNGFHNPAEEDKRVPHTAFIPEPNLHLLGLWEVNRAWLAARARHTQVAAVTLDCDATLVPSDKDEAIFCYEGYKAYQPLNFYCPELDQIVFSEFRDGNVPAGYRQLPALQTALGMLPPSVRKVSFRGDSASYDHQLLKYLARDKDPRFGVIDFAVGADLSTQLQKAIEQGPERGWRALPRGRGQGRDKEPLQEWTEVDFVPDAICDCKRDEGYRYLAIRERYHPPQRLLPGMERHRKLPFQTLALGPNRRLYKVFALVTNRDLPGEELIRWYRRRCGKDEETHSVLKSDLGGGQMPSGKFGANAAWWAIAALAYNLHATMKRLVLPSAWAKRRLKALRYALIGLSGRVRERGRQLFVGLTRSRDVARLLIAMRRRIVALATCATN